MPKKIRELKAMLRKAGFKWRPGKGSHQIWEHPSASKGVTMSGNDGRDARRYQEAEVAARIAEVEQAEKA